MRPPGPEPVSVASATPFSSATFFASGEALTRSPPGAGAVLEGAAAGAFAAAGVAGATGAAGAAGADSSIFSSFVPMMPMRVWTGTLAPSEIKILRRMPESKASRSMVALSVSTSARMSPDLTASPSFLIHLTRVPSVMEGLSRGMRMSLAIKISGERFAGFQFDKLRGDLVLRQFFFESFRRAGGHPVPRAPMAADGEFRFEQVQRVGGL